MVIDSEPDEDDTVVVLTGPGREGARAGRQGVNGGGQPAGHATLTRVPH